MATCRGPMQQAPAIAVPLVDKLTAPGGGGDEAAVAAVSKTLQRWHGLHGNSATTAASIAGSCDALGPFRHSLNSCLHRPEVPFVRLVIQSSVND